MQNRGGFKALPWHVQEKLITWRLEERKKEEASYVRHLSDLESFLVDSNNRLPRYYRKPKNDDQRDQ